MHDSHTWRNFLETIIRDPKERLRLAETLGINRATLVRWSKNETTPRQRDLEDLIEILPDDQREQMIILIKNDSKSDFPDFLKDTSPNSLPERKEVRIPSSFYAEALNMYRDTPRTLRFWSMCHLILPQIIAQLDPRRLGMEIVVAQCTPPGNDGKVHSLRESIGLGTSPWRNDIHIRQLFLGAESLGGYALTSGPAVLQNIAEEQHLLPARQVEHEASAAAYPIVRESSMAGCLLVTSTQANYFNEERLLRLEQYANLIGLAFHDQVFYKVEVIELSVMPLLSVQQTVMAHFRNRVSTILVQSLREGQTMSREQAETQVYQELETELLQSFSSEENAKAL